MRRVDDDTKGVEQGLDESKGKLSAKILEMVSEVLTVRAEKRD